MKRIYLFVLFTVTLITSCKKEYTCTCTTSISDSSFILTSIDDNKPYDKKMTKKTAESACKAEQASIETSYKNMFQSIGGYTIKTTCDLR